MSATFESIMKDIRARKFQPVYFLHGTEPYFIDQIENAIEQSVLDEADKAFNQTVVYGKDTDLSTIVSTAQRFPMMSEYQVVIVREAQELKGFLKGKKPEDEEGESTEKEVSKSKVVEKDPLIEYLKAPLKSTILVLSFKHKAVDKRLKVYKELEKSAITLETKQLYAEKVPAFIASYVKDKGFKISDNCGRLLTEYLGAELSKITNELDKVMIGLPKGSEISPAIIEQKIGISKDFNVFELTAALSRKDVLKANAIINYFGANSKANPMVLTIGALNNHFNKIITYHAFSNQPGMNLATALKVNPYFLKDYDVASRNYSLGACVRIIGWLHEYDLKSKGVGSKNTTEHDLLRELIFKILHPNAIPA